jgi:Tfp pilus assembly protein PilO
MLTVRGTYHAIGSFLTEIGSLPRIVTPTQLKLTVPPTQPSDKKGQPMVEAGFRIVTYVIPEPASMPADSGAVNAAN